MVRVPLAMCFPKFTVCHFTLMKDQLEHPQRLTLEFLLTEIKTKRMSAFSTKGKRENGTQHLFCSELLVH